MSKLVRCIVNTFLPVLAILPTLTHAQWTRSGDWLWGVSGKSTSAITYSEKFGQNVTLWVWFGASSKCSPSIMYAQTESAQANRKAEGAFQGGFQVRIDTRSPWDVKPGAAQAFYASPTQRGTIDYVITLDAPVKFILELAYGQTFRVLRTDTGETDRFSLTGSAVAIGNAFRACEQRWGRANDPDLQYFNQGQYQQQRSPQAQPPQDADRQFFR